MKLKTLKDLEFFNCGDSGGKDAIEIRKLRQEAIKHIKFILKKEKISIKIHKDMSLELDRKPEGYSFGKAIGQIQSYITFFNIKEEELK